MGAAMGTNGTCIFVIGDGREGGGGLVSAPKFLEQASNNYMYVAHITVSNLATPLLCNPQPFIFKHANNGFQVG